jgi:ABC-type Fe3+-siderophore transport system permease subunit
MAQKEYEADVKAQDALVIRGNTLLAATGVALSLVVSFAKEKVIDTDARRMLLGLALVAATTAILLVVLSMRLRRVQIRVESLNIVGESISEGDDPALWQRDHELSMALVYFELRMNIAKPHDQRASWLAAAQWAYLCFLLLISALGLTILF